MKKITLIGAVAMLSVAASAASASIVPSPAGSVTDAKWSAWYGCWRPEAVDGVAQKAHVICVLPGEGAGVSIATIADGRILSEQMVVADGARRPTDEGGCKGFESASWSQDGRRVFMTSHLNCGGDIERVSTGVLALTSTGSYVDVQAVEVAGQKASRTVRYTAIPESETPTIVADRLKSEPLVRESARLRASTPLDFEDVVEATRVIGAEATNGLLVARRTGFELDANRLRQLVAAGVQPATVDVMVALSYPEHFQVAEEAPRAASTGNIWGGDNSRGSFGMTSSCYDRYSLDRYSTNYAYDPYGSRYSRCGYNTSYYSPYGYDTYGWGYGTGQVVVLQPSSGDEVNGVAIKGKGYSRRGEATGTARPRTTTTTTTQTTRSAGTSSTAGSGSVTTKGSSGSSGSSAQPTGRTAKPKGGGGE